jgi:hypothetical protein
MTQFETKMELLTEENFLTSYLRFEDRQAGVGLVYSPDDGRYSYNAYCLEMTLLKELLTVEYEFLEDALACVNEEFGTWDLVPYEDKNGCSSCSAH